MTMCALNEVKGMCGFMEHMNITQFNSWAKNNLTDDSKFDNDGFIIMENNNNFKSTGIISNIFEDHFDNYYSKYKLTLDKYRPNAYNEVHKVIDCANHNLGASVYVCPNCSDVLFSHHTCKGKLCSSCGIKSQILKTNSILERASKVKHRHITFTIPASLSHWFFYNLNSNNLLFEAVSDTLYSIVNGKVKKKKTRKYNLNYSPGFFAFLHTFYGTYEYYPI